MLEEEGYKVAIVERTGRFIFPKDAFGLFDLLALGGMETRLIQVSTNKPHPHKAFKKFREQNPYCPVIFEQYCWIDGGKLKRWEY